MTRLENFNEKTLNFVGLENLTKNFFFSLKTKIQWIELQEQFDKTPDCREDTSNTILVPGGQHWILMQLIRSITGITPGTRQDAVQMAHDILSLLPIEGTDEQD